MGEIKRDSWLDLAWVLQFADPCSRIHSKLVITCMGRHREGRGLGALSLRRRQGLACARLARAGTLRNPQLLFLDIHVQRENSIPASL